MAPGGWTWCRMAVFTAIVPPSDARSPLARVCRGEWEGRDAPGARRASHHRRKAAGVEDSAWDSAASGWMRVFARKTYTARQPTSDESTRGGKKAVVHRASRLVRRVSCLSVSLECCHVPYGRCVSRGCGSSNIIRLRLRVRNITCPVGRARSCLRSRVTH